LTVQSIRPWLGNFFQETRSAHESPRYVAKKQMRSMATDFAKRDLAIILSNQDATRNHDSYVFDRTRMPVEKITISNRLYFV